MYERAPSWNQKAGAVRTRPASHLAAHASQQTQARGITDPEYPMTQVATMSDQPARDAVTPRKRSLQRVAAALLAVLALGAPAPAAEKSSAGLLPEEEAWIDFLEMNGIEWGDFEDWPEPWEVPDMLDGPLTWPDVDWAAVDDDPFDGYFNDIIFPGPGFCNGPGFTPLPPVRAPGRRARRRQQAWMNELGAPFDDCVLVLPRGATVDLCELMEDVGLEILEEKANFIVARTDEGREGNEAADAQWISGMFPDLCGLEPDPVAFMPGGSHANIIIVGSSFGRQFDKQTAVRSLRLPPVHEDLRGAGVVVAVLDTGIDAEHPLFEGRLLPGVDLVDDDALPAEQRNGVDDDEDGQIDEGYGHGTLVAGIVLAAAPKATILPIRVLDTDGRSSSSRVADGIYHAIEAGADVINLSLGTQRYSMTLSAAVQTAIDAGVLVVAAAGNGGDPWMVEFPSAEYGVVSVSALGAGGRRAGWANGGRRTSVGAPGRGVIGPYPGTPTEGDVSIDSGAVTHSGPVIGGREIGGNWARGTGTSFSTPLVSGIAALLIEHSPDDHASEIYAELASRWRLNARRLTR